jgi:hypothetical protein
MTVFQRTSIHNESPRSFEFSQEDNKSREFDNDDF